MQRVAEMHSNPPYATFAMRRGATVRPRDLVVPTCVNFMMVTNHRKLHARGNHRRVHV